MSRFPVSSPTLQPHAPPNVLDEDLTTHDLAARRAANPQLFENSPLSGSSVHDEYSASEDRFYNSKDPNLAIKHEQPVHRLMVMLKAQGKTNKKIAELTGKNECWVSQVLRQPWARQLLIRELREAGRDGIQALLEGEMENSVQTLIELRDSAQAEGSVRRGAANDLLDRFLGKPTQRVEQTQKVSITSTTIDELNAELAELEREEKRLVGKN